MDHKTSPRLDAQSGKTKSLVIFCHGYGADGNDLIGIGAQWAKTLPDTSFVSPHAPEPCAMMPVGRQWFPLTMRDKSEYWRGTTAAAPVLDHFIDAEMEYYQLSSDKVALVGFSQGTMMSLHVGPRRKNPLAGILGYSGLLAGPEHLENDLVSKPPIQLIHGQLDEVIPFQAMGLAKKALRQAGIEVHSHACPHIGHGIDADGLTLGAGFLKKVLYQ